jgi:hypothetical protein
MDIKSFFTARFQTTIAGFPFTSEVECENTTELREACQKLHAANDSMELIAARIGLDLAKPSSGCHLFDDDSEHLYIQVLKDLGVGAEHFFNERMGWYDKFNNRVEPADMGMLFPDGALRLVWRQEESKLNFDETLRITKRALEFLLQMQEVPYLCATEDEYNENNVDGVRDRRTQALFEAGLWPDQEGEYEEVEEDRVAALLEQYRGMTVPQSQAA